MYYKNLYARQRSSSPVRLKADIITKARSGLKVRHPRKNRLQIRIAPNHLLSTPRLQFHPSRQTPRKEKRSEKKPNGEPTALERFNSCNRGLQPEGWRKEGENGYRLPGKGGHIQWKLRMVLQMFHPTSEVEVKEKG
jgi:hypothetical protein